MRHRATCAENSGVIQVTDQGERDACPIVGQGPPKPVQLSLAESTAQRADQEQQVRDDAGCDSEEQGFEHDRAWTVASRRLHARNRPYPARPTIAFLPSAGGAKGRA